MKILVLGAGLVGRPMAVDLAEDSALRVTVADLDRAALSNLRRKHPHIEVQQADLTDAQMIKALVAPFDLVVHALPGSIGFHSLKSVIEAGKDVVDIAFFDEDPYLLNDIAKQNGVAAVIDCGVSPGMSNVLVSLGAGQLDRVEDVLILVGGLPRNRVPPYEYKAVFSPSDVIEEYTRPARIVENGVVTTRPALSEGELIEFDEVGTLEAFNSDGLRTLLKSISADNMREKTLRYPGHREKMALLRDTGFFGTSEVEINGQRVRPLDLSSRLLFPLWKLEENEEDLTVMRVSVTGIKDGSGVRHQYDLLDHYDPLSGVHSMARTTGYTATAVAKLILSGEFKETGIIAPEVLGTRSEWVEFLLGHLRDRGIHYQHSVEKLSN